MTTNAGGRDIAATSNSLTGLAARINDAHARAIEHAGTAITQAIACGKMLLEPKGKVPHGQWLPWLRANVAFSERSAQGYMRIAQRLPNPQRVADMPLRRVLGELRTPLLAGAAALDEDLRAWTAESRAAAGKPVAEWIIEDAKACADRIRAYDEIMHRYGICPWVGDPEPCCLVCDDEADAEARP